MSKCPACEKESCNGLCSGKCENCGVITMMYSYISKSFLCLKHYSEMIKNIKVNA